MTFILRIKSDDFIKKNIPTAKNEMKLKISVLCKGWIMHNLTLFREMFKKETGYNLIKEMLLSCKRRVS
jgi:hypothetical protein